MASATAAGAAEGGLGPGRLLDSPQLPEFSLLRHQEATLLWPCTLISAQGYKFIVSHTGIPPPHPSLAAFFFVSETTMTVGVVPPSGSPLSSLGTQGPRDHRLSSFLGSTDLTGRPQHPQVTQQPALKRP